MKTIENVRKYCSNDKKNKFKLIRSEGNEMGEPFRAFHEFLQKNLTNKVIYEKFRS